jgi:hypothetical protein
MIDLPTPLQTDAEESTYKLGETEDWKFCIVDIHDNALVSWFLTTNDDGAVERWMMYMKVPLRPIVKEFIGCLIEDEGCNVYVHLLALINGFGARGSCSLACWAPPPFDMACPPRVAPPHQSALASPSRSPPPPSSTNFTLLQRLFPDHVWRNETVPQPRHNTRDTRPCT